MSWLTRFLYPEEMDFFTPMERVYALILESARLFRDAGQAGPLTPAQKELLVTELKKRESAGDEIVRLVVTGLKHSFTPPFSPLELRRLFDTLDDILDGLDEAAKTHVHAGHREDFPPFAAEQLDALTAGIEYARGTVALLRDPRRNAKALSALVASISDCEKRGDEIYWRAKRALAAEINSAAREGRLADFRRAMMDEKTLDHLEWTLDRLVAVIQVVEDMVIEHA